MASPEPSGVVSSMVGSNAGDDRIPSGPPRIALKLTPDAHKQQQSNPRFIPDLILKADPELGLIPRVSPLITCQPSDVVLNKVTLAARLDPNYKGTNFDAWYQVLLESQIGITVKGTVLDTAADFSIPSAILKLIHKLHNVEEVESVHALQHGPPPVDPTNDPRSGNEGYIDAAPVGIDARYAWGFLGGDGNGVNVVDMEQGWNLNHEDLKAANITLISGTNTAYFYHGTSVLGEMLMVDNTIGGIGIAPSAKGRVVSQFQPGGYNTAAAILDAITHMSFGDILLLEAQEHDPVSGQYKWPVEIVDSTYQAIRLATALGITVVEPACNGGFDLDTYVNLFGKQIFNRSSQDFRDSGAIMVGASSSAAPHSKLYFSCYGTRVDAYGWGENIDTTTTDSSGTNNSLYTTGFNGTSGASPIVTGAAMIAQGLALAHFNFKLAPLQIRKILTTNGTPSNNPPVDRIGVLPNLKAIINGSYINLAPDLYIRDYVGDIGNTTTGTVSNSPDIIVRQNPVANPQAVFGQGSVTVNDPNLSESVLGGHDHSIYIRVRNRGGSSANAATAKVFWSMPSTLVTPQLWKEIGVVKLRSVPTGDSLTVFPRLPWPAAAVPPTGHYCFVALIGAANDPTPNLPNTFPDFYAFVRNNNNVAWHNFNVISAPPSESPRSFHVFPFGIPGAFDAARRFAIKSLGSLPPSAEVCLKLPLTLSRALGITLQERQVEGDYAVLPLHPFAAADIGEGVLPIGSFANCELHVRVPEETYKQNGRFEFAILQEWEGIEVGRLTYHFGPGTPLGKGDDECKCGCHHHGCHHHKC